MDKRKAVILLTGSIDPKLYKMFSSLEREKQYTDTLKYYLINFPEITRIVFIENSGWPLDNIRKEVDSVHHGKLIEFISFNISYPSGMQHAIRKSYGESACIMEGMRDSRLLNDGSLSYIIKITGRLQIRNLSKLIDFIPEPFDFACDIKDHGWILRRFLGVKNASPYCDTRIFILTRNFYNKYFKDIHGEVRKEPLALETVVYKTVKCASSENAKIIKRFPVEPDFVGLSGSFKGNDYDSSGFRIIKIIRGALRKFIPMVHI